MDDNRAIAQLDQNIFREYDIRGIVGVHLTDENVPLICRGIGAYFSKRGATRAAVGYDARRSSPGFADILTSELNASGLDVILIGRVPTPVLYYALHKLDVDCGVMITGSHNPPDHNGFKVSLGAASLYGDEIREIGGLCQRLEFVTGLGSVQTREILTDYCADLTGRISMGDRKIKVVVDAGNGMGAVTALPIYEKLGAEVVPLFAEPNSDFPNHHPDPTVPENLTDLINAVRENDADAGIAFDGDADRIGVVDETGRIIWGDELTILFARSVLAENPGATVIGEVKCSQTLFDDIASHGGVPLMWKAGHSLIKAKMKETGALLAGEMSGHIFFADRFYGFDDAAYAGARLLEILSKTDSSLSALLADIPKLSSTPEIRIDCPEHIKFAVVNEIARYFAFDHAVDLTDGARITFENGWGLVRASNTQALLVLRFEADTEEHLMVIQAEVEARVRQAIG